MRVPLTWLKEFVDVALSPAELAYRLTVAGVEVSKIEYVGIAPGGPNTFGVSEEPGLAWDRTRIVVGQIVEVMPHPNADRLVLADVDYGARELHRVVTGAPNIFHLKGQGRLADGPKVVFAREGSQLYDGHAEGQKLMTLKPSKIRGIPSSAMVCSEKELGLSEEHEGIIILDADAPVGMPLADYMGDVVLHIEILPNIARCQSIIGVAREVAALTGAQFKGTDQGRLGASKPALEVVEAAEWVKLQIGAAELCPRYSAALIRDVHIGPSPEWMQRRLRLVGVRAISNIVDITNYVMMEWGQPLHAFDYDKLVSRAAATSRPAVAPELTPVVSAVAEPPRIDDVQHAAAALPGSHKDIGVQHPPASDAGPSDNDTQDDSSVLHPADAGRFGPRAGDVRPPADGPHVASDRDRWLDDGGPTRAEATTVADVAPSSGDNPSAGTQADSSVLHSAGVGDVRMAVDTPHVSSAADRWADDGGHPPVTAPTIIVRRAREGEHLTTLDGVDRALTTDMLLIADTAGAIALAGIMGGAETEIDEHTTNVLLEAAAFNFINNRKTAAALKLPSEATARFGRGVPPAHTIPSATRAADLMRQLAQGKLAPQIVDAYPGRAPQPVIHFDTAEIRRLLGVDVPVERITSILKALDFGVRVLGGSDADQDDSGVLSRRADDDALGESGQGFRPPAVTQDDSGVLSGRAGDVRPPAVTQDDSGVLSGTPGSAHPRQERGAGGQVADDDALGKSGRGSKPAAGRQDDPGVPHGRPNREASPAAAQLEITVPEHRLDVAIPADIVEEVARVIGYDQIPPTLMRDELPPQRHNSSLEMEDLVRDIMVGCGLQEVISYPLTTVEREALLFPDPAQADLDPGAYVTIANPISPERKVMRHTLLSSLLDTLREALRHRERVLLFEIGRVYLPSTGSNLPSEHTRLTIALAGPREPQSWLRGKRTAPLDFFDLKGIVDTLVQRLRVEAPEFSPSEHPTFHPARSATLSAGGQQASHAAHSVRHIGVFGEVHPEVREHFDLPHDPVCLAEFDLDALRAEIGAARFQKLPRFPAIREDIAVVVDEDMPAAQVETVIREAGGAMLRSVTLFDLYRGEQVGAGRKSLAYALTYQHDERTLTDDEAAKIRGRIVKKLRDTVGAELRG